MDASSSQTNIKSESNSNGDTKNNGDLGIKSETTDSEQQADTKVPSQPVPTPRLLEIATEACDSTFESVTNYEHSQTGAWNSKIINTVLQSLVSATANPKTPGRHPYKFSITSTIIQHTTSSFPPTSQGDNTGDLTSSENRSLAIGKRGIHSATGAFWNNARDGCWNFKYEKPGKDFDVVVSVIWMAPEV